MFGSGLKIKIISLFSLFLLLFMGPTTLWGINVNKIILKKEHVYTLQQFLQMYVSDSLEPNLEYISHKIVVPYE